MERKKAWRWIVPLVVVLAAIVYVLFMFLPKAQENDPEIASSAAEDRPGVIGQRLTVRIGSFSTAIDYAPLIVARAQKRFESAFGPEVTVEYKTMETLPSINEALATGRLDIMFEAEPPALIGLAAGIDLRLAALSCTLQQEVVVPQGAGIKSLKDLKGKKVAVLAGTSSHFGLLRALSQVGLGKDDVEVVDMTPPDAKVAFETGVVKGWAVWPPWVEQEVVSGKGKILQGGDAKIQSIMVLRGGFTGAHSDLARKAIKAIEDTKSWLADNPEEGQRLVAKELSLPVEVVALAWPKHNWRAAIDSGVLDDIQAKADFIAQEGLVKRRVDVRKELLWQGLQ